MRKYVLVWCFLSVFISCSQWDESKIQGISLVSPPVPSKQSAFREIKENQQHWVSIIPYAFLSKDHFKLRYDEKWQWWGETSLGVQTMIVQAQEENLAIMLKPHIWYETGWIGTFKPILEKDWADWEKSYTDYMLNYAELAQKNNVPLFCIGTELREVVKLRPEYWKGFISKIKEVYKGELVYAANWDDYDEVSFWEDLDYIGVNAYFPLSNQKTPSVNELKQAWKPIKHRLQAFSQDQQRKIIFTEYGYESCDYNALEPWGSKAKYKANPQAQYNAYCAFFETFKDIDWVAGGFLWKWHLSTQTMREVDKAFTPQGKKTMQFLKVAKF